MIVKTKKFTIGELASVCHGMLIGDPDITVDSFATDSREVIEGSLFLAIKGERVDGNDYILPAVNAGAACVLSQKTAPEAEGNYIIVEDTVKALGEIAAHHKATLHIPTVAVTGSVGKTTTKDMITSILSQKYKTFKTQGNHNNEIGLPLSLLSLDESYGAAVLEMGMSAKGEIDYLASIARPDIAVITNIGSMHIENLGSREAIRDAKMEIGNYLPKNGTLILNGDEELLRSVAGAFYVSKDNTAADMRVLNVIEGDNGSAFDLAIGRERIESIVLPAFGIHNIFNAALAIAVGFRFGMGEFEIRRGLVEFKAGDMRQHIYDACKITIIEDCYNAGPESMEAALSVLSSTSNKRGKRAVAVLGEMRELGDYSYELHRKVGALAAKAGVELLFTVGDMAKPVADAAVESGMDQSQVIHIPSDVGYDRAALIISGYLHEGDIVLFKASRALRLEALISALEGVLSL